MRPRNSGLERLDPSLTLPLRDHVRRQLRVAILSGHYAPGERLNERTLAWELGVSTTPLKEALRQLESEGLVLTFPRRGIVVQYDRQRAHEMILARAALEAVVAHMAALRITDDAIGDLDTTLLRMTAATGSGDTEQLVAANRQFHEQIHIASQCDHLCRLLEQQQFTDDATRRVIHSEPTEHKRALTEHRALAKAIIAHDAGTAETAMRHHVLRSGDFYLKRVFGTATR